MTNPFEKRATEYLRDDEAFLAVVSPEPLVTFLGEPAAQGRLFDRLVVLRGTPGSGKTTLATLLQFQTVETLLRNRSMSSHRPLVDALTECHLLRDERPLVAGCRLALESEYRDLWEFPYTADLKLGLTTALLQARAILAWIRQMTGAGMPLSAIKLVPRQDASAAAIAIGGTDVESVLARARQVELSVYKISAALVPPAVENLDALLTGPYRPFDVIDRFVIERDYGRGQSELELRPLVILDDAHTLHPVQYNALERWLARRELRVARWVLTRLDVLTPGEVLSGGYAPSEATETQPGLTRARDITEIWLQSNGDDRRNQRLAFRRMAKDMAGRYLRQMPVFSRRALERLEDLLSTDPEVLPPGKRDELARSLDRVQKERGISTERRKSLEEEVQRYVRTAKSSDLGDDVQLAMLGVLMHRYIKRVPQASLFDRQGDPEPSRPLTADPSVIDAARIHLLHRFNRPYYYGMDALCDASSENAEQFLQLAAYLVAASETQLIRAKRATLRSGLQHELLRRRAAEMLGGWDFPHRMLVRRLVDGMARQCLERSLEPNGPLGGGANAFGILQAEFDELPQTNPDLAMVLQFAVAYNALMLVPQYGTKNQVWCLLELGGLPIVHYGLTLRRGGFLERRVVDLTQVLGLDGK